jgi:purine-binding chemotaxis protein CheW
MAALVVFSLADREFALDVSCVREVIRMVAITPIPDAAPEVLGAIIVRGRSFLVMDLRLRFGLAHQGPTSNSPLMLIEAPGSTSSWSCAALVDQVSGVVHLNTGPDSAGMVHIGERLIYWLEPERLLTESMRLLVEER